MKPRKLLLTILLIGLLPGVNMTVEPSPAPEYSAKPDSGGP
ncbi:MAG: hypothetical protein ACYSUB_21425 [Planctomycetota bacterium]